MWELFIEGLDGFAPDGIDGSLVHQSPGMSR